MFKNFGYNEISNLYTLNKDMFKLKEDKKSKSLSFFYRIRDTK